MASSTFGGGIELGPRPALHVVNNRPGVSTRQDDLDLCLPLDRFNGEQTKAVGCARGVLVAIGFQAVALLAGIGLWELHFLLR